ncbi:transposase [Dactylosporangium sp. NPDC000555]|uniref:transposase n=1 Tax=Dactylosporangium sp. NPDC000555 TaxID=3154260 RepID=UPI003328E424
MASGLLLARHDCPIRTHRRRMGPAPPAAARRPRARRGGWGDQRTVISGILFRERTGIRWRDLPTRFGNWKTVYQRKRRWALDGTWQRVAGRLRLDADLDDGDEWTLGIDSSVVRAHQHAAGARHQPPADRSKP